MVEFWGLANMITMMRTDILDFPIALDYLLTFIFLPYVAMDFSYYIYRYYTYYCQPSLHIKEPSPRTYSMHYLLTNIAYLRKLEDAALNKREELFLHRYSVHVPPLTNSMHSKTTYTSLQASQCALEALLDQNRDLLHELPKHFPTLVKGILNGYRDKAYIDYFTQFDNVPAVVHMKNLFLENREHPTVGYEFLQLLENELHQAQSLSNSH